MVAVEPQRVVGGMMRVVSVLGLFLILGVPLSASLANDPIGPHGVSERVTQTGRPAPLQAKSRSFESVDSVVLRSQWAPSSASGDQILLDYFQANGDQLWTIGVIKLASAASN